MNSIFVDTSALIAIGNKDDAFHQQAIALQKEYLQGNFRFFTTNAVVLELFNSFSQAQHKSIAIRLINLINNSAYWNCILVDDLIAQGIERFQKRLDKNWSLIDCIGMIVAEDHQITEIFTTDHHFEQAGFTILLKN